MPGATNESLLACARAIRYTNPYEWHGVLFACTGCKSMDVSASVIVAGLTDRGRVRVLNEDKLHFDARLGELVVADGMGGYEGGEVASEIATTVIHASLESGVPALARVGEIDEETGYTGESLLLEKAIHDAHARIQETAVAQDGLKEMGTTVVACLLYDDRLSIASVGDSRLYRLRGEDLDQLTHDHTLIQELVDRGFYTPEEARTSTKRNVLTRALGGAQPVKVDICEDIVVPGDSYLLCSDGLTGMVDDEGIREVLLEHGKDPDECVRVLVDLANRNGGRDNISVLLAHVAESFAVRRGWFHRVMDWLFV